LKQLRISFLTIHPSFIESYKTFGVFSAAIKNNIAEIEVVDLRNYAIDKRGTVDDAPYGGGDGMVLRPEPVVKALEAYNKPYVVYLSPKGETWHQGLAEEFSICSSHIVFICGRFAGLDQRVIDHYVHKEISLGDFVLSGGELAALTVADSILRLKPYVLGHPDSARFDSFSKAYDRKLEHPLYTRPSSFRGHEVPAVLLSGDHEKISTWRKANRERKKTL